MTNLPDYATYLEKVESSFSAQPDKPEETASTILNALWSLAQGVPVSVVAGKDAILKPLAEEEEAKLVSSIGLWSGGEPVAYITERQNFCGLELKVNQDALIPRAETQLLANTVLEKLSVVEEKNPLVLDVCTGCGNLALTYKTRFPSAKVSAADLSVEAIALAKENAQFLEMADEIDFVAGDLFEPFNNDSFLGKVDVLSCNPPYISSKKVPEMPKEISDFEPSMAFDGGPFGISILQRVMSEAPNYLRSSGWLAFEVGAGQGPSIAKMLKRNENYQNVEMIEDESGLVRVIAVQKIG